MAKKWRDITEEITWKSTHTVTGGYIVEGYHFDTCKYAVCEIGFNGFRLHVVRKDYSIEQVPSTETFRVLTTRLEE